MTSTRFRTEPPDPDLKPDYSTRFHLEGYNRIQQQEAYAFYQKWISNDFPRYLVVEIQHANPYYDDSYAVNSENLGPVWRCDQQGTHPGNRETLPGPGRRLGALHLRRFHGRLGSDGDARCSIRTCTTARSSPVPDPIDFQAFTLINIYKDDNAYKLTGEASSVERPAFRNYMGEVFATQRDTNYLELALGDKTRSGPAVRHLAGRIRAERRDDGYPKPVFDKVTGLIDRNVAEYWRSHYDLTTLIEKRLGHARVETAGQTAYLRR